MKRLQLFKSASDFAFANYQIETQPDIDIAAANAFKEKNLDQRDFVYWRGLVNQFIQQNKGLATQLAPSAQADLNKPKIAPAQPAK